MPTFDAGQAECLVFTFKEGLLSPLAHDLKLRVDALEVEASADAVRARFQAGSLRVVCAMRRGREAPGALSAADCREIEQLVARQVLQSDRHPEILFESTRLERRGALWRVAGLLRLRGVSRALEATVAEEGGLRVAEVRLSTPDFGIEPYRGLAGALRVRPEVLIRLSMPGGQGQRRPGAPVAPG